MRRGKRVGELEVIEVMQLRINGKFVSAKEFVQMKYPWAEEKLAEKGFSLDDLDKTGPIDHGGLVVFPMKDGSRPGAAVPKE